MPRFQHKPTIVEATRLDEDTSIPIRNARGEVTGEAGDWLIIGQLGEPYTVSHEVFVANYEAADEAAQGYYERVAGGNSEES